MQIVQHREGFRVLTTCNSLVRLLPNMRSEALNLLENHLPHLWHVFHDLKREIEGTRTVRLI